MPRPTGTAAMPPVLVVGSRNAKKKQEIVDLLAGLNIEIADLTRFPDSPEIQEEGKTFEENAQKKARELSTILHHWVLGEDSGLVVPALHGRPGILSARYAGKHGDDEANNDWLLAELAPLPDDRRAAYYVCTVALSDPSGTIRVTSEGRCHGIITRQRRGTNGFGYDPLFLIPEYHRTFGELSPCVKQAISHRARALAKLRPVIPGLILARSVSEGVLPIN